MKIRDKLLLGNSIFLLLVVISGSILYFSIKNIVQSYIDLEMESITHNSVNLVKTVITSSARNHLRTIATRGKNIAEYHYLEFKKGKISEKEAYQRVKNLFLDPNFAKIGTSGYLAGVSGKGILTIHPKAEGMDASKLEFMKKAMAVKTGYLEYMWKNPGEETERLKAGGLDYFEPWDLIIWASSYKSEFNSFVDPIDFRDEILALRIQKSGYVFILDKTGKVILHPYIEGQESFDSQDSKGNFFVREMLKQKNGRISYDWQNPNETSRREKIAYFKYIPEIDWLVATTIYIDEINEKLNFIKAIILVTFILTSFIIIVVSIKLSSFLARPIQNLTLSINSLKQGNLNTVAKVETTDEIGELARNFNEMATKILEANKELKDLNENLEWKVNERTAQLEKSKNETESQKQETDALNRLLKSLNEDLDFSVVMKKVHNYIKTNYKINYYGLSVVDKDKERLVSIDNQMPDFVSDADRKKSEHYTTRISNVVGAHALAFKSKRPFYAPRVRKSGMTPEELFNQEMTKLESILIIPLVLQNEPIGFLDLYNTGKMNLSRDDITKLSILGEHLAGIIYSSKLFQEVKHERQRSEKLLLNILPEEVANELKLRGMVEPVLFESATIMFTDFKGFTQIAEALHPRELIKELDGCFSQFDKITERYNLEKLKTLGDSYMCAGGIPKPNATHAIDSCLAALEIQSFMIQMKEIKRSIGIPFWELRLGINSGSVVAGVVGEKKFNYDVWGDTVNIASRMESSGTTGKINISHTTYELVKDYFDCEYRGEIDAKNKGKVKMYYLIRIKSEYSKDREGLVPSDKFREIRNTLDFK